MKTMTLLLSLTTALAISAAAPAASALQTEIIATGTVSNSTDRAGIFGPAGLSLDGDSFTAIAYIDTSLGTLVPGAGQSFVGSPAEGTTSPVFETLTINGDTYDFGPNSTSGTGQVTIYDYSQYNQGVVKAAYSDQGSYISQYIYGSTLSVPSMFGEGFYVSADTTRFSSNSAFQIFTSDYSNEATGRLDIATISSPGVVNLTSSAPEPSSWALIIAGVSMIGAALRLGRRRGPLATA